MQKVVISGHCNGIGKAIADKLSLQYLVHGYDISLGQDLTNRDILHSFLNDCADADIIILNAYTTKQHEELLDIYSLFKDEDKHCIIMGTISTDSFHPEIPPAYIEDKSKLEEVFELIFSQDSTLRVSMIRPYWVKTQLTKNVLKESDRVLAAEEVAEAISYVIESDIHISSITLIPKKNVSLYFN